MLSEALPPGIGLAIIHTVVPAHYLVVSCSLLLGRILALLIHITCKPEDRPHALLAEVLDHLCRIGITLMVPVEVVIAGAPRTVDNHGIHRDLPFQIAINEPLSSSCGIQTILPHDMSQGPSRSDGWTLLLYTITLRHHRHSNAQAH